MTLPSFFGEILSLTTAEVTQISVSVIRVEIEGAGNYFVPLRYKHKLSFKIRNATFEAGEAKVFSPLFHSEYNPYSQDGTGNLLHEGWRPGHSFLHTHTTQSLIRA